MTIKDDFFEDLSKAYDSWLESLVGCLTNEADDLKWVDNTQAFEVVRSALTEAGVPVSDIRQVISEVLIGQIVSVLTILDGGTKLAETEKIELVDSNGKIICSDLHNNFVTHLLDSGRMQ